MKKPRAEPRLFMSQRLSETWPVEPMPIARAATDMPASHKRSSIIDAHDDASVVADFHPSAKWQGAVRRSHGRAIHMLAIRSATTTKSVRASVDACDFRVCRVDCNVSKTRH